MRFLPKHTAPGQLNATSQPDQGQIMGNIWGEMGIPHSPVIPWTILALLLHKMEEQSPLGPQLCTERCSIPQEWNKMSFY